MAADGEATSYVTAKGRPLEFRVKLGNKISDDGHTYVQEYQLLRKVSKKKWRIVLTLELDTDKSKKGVVDFLYRHKKELWLMVHCDCPNKEVTVRSFWECRNEGWDWASAMEPPTGEDWDKEPLEMFSKTDGGASV